MLLRQHGCVFKDRDLQPMAFGVFLFEWLCKRGLPISVYDEYVLMSSPGPICIFHPSSSLVVHWLHQLVPYVESDKSSLAT